MMYSGHSRGLKKPPTIPHGSSMAGAGVSVVFGGSARSPAAVEGQRIPGVASMPTSTSFDTASDIDMTRTHSGGLPFLRKRSGEPRSKVKAEDMSYQYELSEEREMDLNRTGKFQNEVTMSPCLHGKIVSPGKTAALYAASKIQGQDPFLSEQQQRRDGVDSLSRTGMGHLDQAHRGLGNIPHSRSAPSTSLSGKLSFANYSQVYPGNGLIEPNRSFEENRDVSLTAVTSYDEGFEVKNPFGAEISIQESKVAPSPRPPFGQSSGNIPDPTKRMTRAEKRIFLARQAFVRAPKPEVPGLV